MKMKNELLAFLSVLALWPCSAAAQGPDNDVSIDVFLPLMSPVSRLAGEDMYWLPLNIKYQRVVANHLVLTLKGGLNYSWTGPEKIVDVYPMIELDWHPFHTGLKGFYLGPSAFFNYTTYRNSTEGTDHAYCFALGGTVGWEIVLRSHMTIDFTFGLGDGYNVEVDVDGTKTTDVWVDETIAGVYLGYAF